MRLALAFTLFAATALPAAAQQPARTTVNALAGSCAAVSQAAPSQGVVVLKTGRGSGPWDYERVVRDGSYCFPRQEAYPIWVETRDNARCYVGFTCEENRQGRLH